MSADGTTRKEQRREIVQRWVADVVITSTAGLYLAREVTTPWAEPRKHQGTPQPVQEALNLAQGTLEGWGVQRADVQVTLRQEERVTVTVQETTTSVGTGRLTARDFDASRGPYERMQVVPEPGS